VEVFLPKTYLVEAIQISY